MRHVEPTSLPAHMCESAIPQMPLHPMHSFIIGNCPLRAAGGIRETTVRNLRPRDELIGTTHRSGASIGLKEDTVTESPRCWAKGGGGLVEVDLNR